MASAARADRLLVGAPSLQFAGARRPRVGTYSNRGLRRIQSPVGRCLPVPILVGRLVRFSQLPSARHTYGVWTPLGSYRPGAPLRAVLDSIPRPLACLESCGGRRRRSFLSAFIVLHAGPSTSTLGEKRDRSAPSHADAALDTETESLRTTTLLSHQRRRYDFRMASGNSNTSNNSIKEQLLVCWLEPQSDAGKVSAIPASWIVSTVSGDGRSPNSVVRCRWPRTKRLYRARIVPSADQPTTTQTGKEVDDDDLEDDRESGRESSDKIEKRALKEEPISISNSNDESSTVAAAIMVKEEMKTNRNSVSTVGGTSMASIISTTTASIQSASTQQHTIAAPTTSTTTSSISQTSPVIDAATLAQALLPTLKKLFNNELSKLSTDIQANFDIIGHKISALDGTVKCIKTRVDRMETLLNTAAQELGDNQPSSTPAHSNNFNNLSLSSMNTARSQASSSMMNNSDLFTGAARNFNLSNINQNTSIFSSQQQQQRNVSVAGSTPAGRNSSASSTNNSISARNSIASATAHALQMQQQRRQQLAGSQNRFGNQFSSSPTPVNSRSSTSAVGAAISSMYSRQAPTSISLASLSGQRAQNSGAASSNAPLSSGPSKRRRTTATTNPTLPKAVVITAPNGIDVYLGGDKNYKMPLVMYKDALKNCTRPIATYMVMALIRRYLTPDEMSRTWLTEQQLLGKKDGILLDQVLLTALKKQAQMQFPGSSIDDRLLVRKLYDVFHGIRRQMRKKRREGGDLGFGHASLLDSFGGDRGASMAGMNENDADSGSANGDGDGEDEGMDDDSPRMEHGSGDFDDDHGHDFDGDDDGLGHEEAERTESGDGGRLNLEHEQDGDDDDDLLGEGLLNGDEVLEEVAAKQAAFWAGADEDF